MTDASEGEKTRPGDHPEGRAHLVLEEDDHGQVFILDREAL